MTETQAHAFDVLASPVRRAILESLANLPVLSPAGSPNRSSGRTAADLADVTGLHITTVRFHLDRLVQAGLVETHEERAGVGRPRRRYTAHPGHLVDVAPPDAYRLVAEVLAEAMASGDGPDAAEAGRRWAVRHAAEHVGHATTAPARSPGTWLAKVGVVVDVLDRWGYEPTVSTTDGGRSAQVCLHHCPLRHLADTNPAVACGVHRGVIAGTLEALGEHDATVRLLPFSEPDTCVAALATAAPFTDHANRPERH